MTLNDIALWFVYAGTLQGRQRRGVRPLLHGRGNTNQQFIAARQLELYISEVRAELIGRGLPP